MILGLLGHPSTRAVARIVAPLLVVGLSATLALLVTSVRPGSFQELRPASSSSASAGFQPAGGRASIGPSGASSTASPPAPSAVLGSRRLSGDGLARAWLTAFCTRRDRYDDQWVRAVSRLSSPEVVRQLRAEGPDAVGLTNLTSWRVGPIDRVDLHDQPLETPTRQVLAYAVTVTDGTHTEQKPFVLYAYLDPDGLWRVGQVEQPYSSEG